MAETLGSLIDKFTIKAIREYHIQEMIDQDDKKFSADELKDKLDLLEEQKKDLSTEINGYVQSALANPDMILRDEKIKLYNARDIIGDIGNVSGLAEAIEGLTQKNLELYKGRFGDRNWSQIDFKQFSKKHNPGLKSYVFGLDAVLENTSK